MDNQKELKITISGFGRFGNVIDNPTSIMVSGFSYEFKKKYNITQSEVLEVSTVACDQYISSLPDDCLNIHFGVFDGSYQFNVEECGYNLKDFGIPDMRGYIGNNECIEKECDIDTCRQTKLNTEKLVDILSKKFPVQQSSDPGRYICNYIYYCSLKKSHQCPKASSLFVHFPAFRTIPKETQLNFIESLLETLHKLHKGGQLFQ